MFENVDEFLLCRPYVGILSLVVGRLQGQYGFIQNFQKFKKTLTNRTRVSTGYTRGDLNLKMEIGKIPQINNRLKLQDNIFVATRPRILREIFF